MKKMLLFCQKGGPLPWEEFNGTVLNSIWQSLKEEFQRCIKKNIKRHRLLKWSDFKDLEVRSEELDCLCRISKLGEFLDLEGMEELAEKFEKERNECNLLISHSRCLMWATKRLIQSHKGWKRKALEDSCWGFQSYYSTREKQEEQALMDEINRLEKSNARKIKKAKNQCLLEITNEEELKGLTAIGMKVAKKRALKKEFNGWLLSTHYDEYCESLSFLKNREVRQRLYELNANLFSKNNEHDLTENIQLLIQKRQELAQLNKFNNFAEYAVCNSVLNEVSRIEKELKNIFKTWYKKEQEEAKRLYQWMKEHCGIQKVEPWDIAFGIFASSTDSREDDLDQMQFFFDKNEVLDKCIDEVARFLGVEIKNHPELSYQDVLAYEIKVSEDERHWVYIVKNKRELKTEVIAFEWPLILSTAMAKKEASSIVFLQWNENEAYLSHEEVSYIFHEMGHACHRVLSKSRHFGELPFRIEADMGEFHSQLIEQLAFDKDVLKRIAQQDGCGLSDEEVDQCLASLNEFKGFFKINEVLISLYDLKLHTKKPLKKEENLNDLCVEVFKELMELRSETDLNPNQEMINDGRFRAVQLSSCVGESVCTRHSYVWSFDLAEKVYQKSKELNQPLKVREKLFEKGVQKRGDQMIKDFLRLKKE